MGVTKIENELAAMELYHQAICRTCRWEGSRHRNVDHAYIDAENHYQEPGNEHHSVRVDTTQRTSFRYFKA